MKYEPKRPSSEFLSTKAPPHYDPNSDYQLDFDYSFSQRLNKNKERKTRIKRIITTLKKKRVKRKENCKKNKNDLYCLD